MRKLRKVSWVEIETSVPTANNQATEPDMQPTDQFLSVELTKHSPKKKNKKENKNGPAMKNRFEQIYNLAK